MKILKLGSLILVCLIVIAQFIRPPKNIPSTSSMKDISHFFSIPRDVHQILSVACYDCHSDSTRYPWYAGVQPVGWWLNNHIRQGKRHLNFSEFGAYRLRQQYGKFDDIISEVSDEGMPLPSYRLVHSDARLSQEQKDRLIGWAKDMMDSMRIHYPPDSLVRPRR